MQDFTGVPAVVDLAAMRDAMQALGGDPEKINPLVPVDLVIDHSVIVNFFGNNRRSSKNVDEEYKQNQERYEFLKWGQKAFDELLGGAARHRHLPSGQSRISRPDGLDEEGEDDHRAGMFEVAYPDTLVGTDSHTTMVNGLAVLGWGVGGIEAEAAMLGQPLSMLLPEVIGFKLTGKLKEGVTATDLVLTVTQMLRKKGVVGKFVEFFGPGLDHLSLADKATIGNMAPEYGATCGFFPVDGRRSNISTRRAARRPRRAGREVCQGAGHVPHASTPDPVFTDTLTLDLGYVVPSLAGPKRPQDRVRCRGCQAGFAARWRTNSRRPTSRRAYASRAARPSTSAMATW
jgi:aconitate hydratase